MKVWHLLLNYWYPKIKVNIFTKVVCLTCIKVLSWFLTSSGQLSRSLWSLVTLVLICLTSAVKASTVNLSKKNLKYNKYLSNVLKTRFLHRVIKLLFETQHKISFVMGWEWTYVIMNYAPKIIPYVHVISSIFIDINFIKINSFEDTLIECYISYFDEHKSFMCSMKYM